MTMATEMATKQQQQQQQEDDLVNWHLLEDPEVMEKCKNDLEKSGVMVINEFATTSGLERLRQEIMRAPYSEVQEGHHTPWEDRGDPNYPKDYASLD